MSAVWIVDDDHSIRWVLERALTREGFTVRSFGSVREALSALDGDAPEVVVSDIRMPGESGLELLQQLRLKRPSLPVIIMTAYSDLDSAVSAFQGGAFEYLPKPFDLNAAVELIHRAMTESRREAAAEEILDDAPEMLGQAPAMQEVFRAIGRLSQSNVTVLITGESGSGKELVARALHRHSPRADKPFVALNTAAIPRDLLESELFGHERGAFTGAQQTRRGRFEQAEGGTLFLDEIGDMPAELQTRLLRVLSDGHYYRVGGLQPLKSNVRVIAATHQHLEDRVRQGLFREDLFHRLNVIRLRLPPLRERREDIPLLTRHFLQSSARELGVETKRLTEAALAALQRFSWPGNVRQLENVCNWLTVMAPAQTVEPKDLPPEVREGLAGTESVSTRGDGAAMVGAAPAPSIDGVTQAGREFPLAVGALADPSLLPVPQDNSVSAIPALRVPDTGGLPAFPATARMPDGYTIRGQDEGVFRHEGSIGARDEGEPIGFLNPGSTFDTRGFARATGTTPRFPDAMGMKPGEGMLPGSRTADTASGQEWARLLEHDVARMLATQPADPDAPSLLMDRLSREFESTVIRTALRYTRGRRIEAAQRLGIGRNTITRKIQELRLEDD